MRKFLRGAAAANLLLISLASHATAETKNTLQQVVVTANRNETELSKTGSSATIVNAEELEKRKQASVLEVLRSVAGLEVVQVGSRGRQTSVFIRGNESDHTLVLIDGIRVNSNGDGAFDFADLKAESIEKIEIVRGPQSVLYGSEAIGGVINIFTKRASKGLNASAQATGGSHGTQDYVATLGWGSDEAHAQLTTSYLDSDGVSAAQAKNGNPESDGYENTSLAGKAGITFLKDGQLETSARYFKGRTDLDGFAFGSGAIDDLNATQEREFVTASATIRKPILEWLTPSVSLGLVDEELEGIDADTIFQNFSIKNKTISTTAQIDIVPFEHNTISVGYSFEQKETENVGNFDEERDVNSFFLQDQMEFNESLFITAGIRHDDDSKFGDETTYRATVAYLLEDSATRLHGSFGTAFKAPTFNELFFPNFGNPNLNAETSTGFDIGIEQGLFQNAVILDVTYFQNKIDDLITFDTTTFLAENIQEAKTWGIESSASFLFWEWLTANVTYTFTDTENKSTGMELSRRPRHRATASFFIEPVAGLSVTPSLLLVNHRIDSDGAKMENYERVDLTISYNNLDNIQPFVRVENLFDETYEEVPSYGTPGFEIFGGIKVSL